jgi:hypothetical protein
MYTHDKLTDDFPRHGWIKCNTDGALISQNQQAGCGGIYRDDSDV